MFTFSHAQMAVSKIGEFIVWLKYARFRPEDNRRETWPEIVQRNLDMHLKKFAKYPEICSKLRQVYKDFVLPMKIVPSARSLQYAGEPIFENNARIYNCGFTLIEDLESIDEIVFLLMSGCGIGFSVEKWVIDKLPPAQPAELTEVYVVPDTKEGWALAYRQLIGSYFGKNAKPLFDFSKIRPAGSPLKVSGGTASGPATLIKSLKSVEKILDRLKPGDKLSPLQVFDIVCHGAECVQAGGSRRSSLVCLFSNDDMDMITCKDQANIAGNEQRYWSNNPAVFYRSETTKADFDRFCEIIGKNRTGEPGIYWSNRRGTGTNPCVEVGQNDGQMCNLAEINGSTVTTQTDFEERAAAASFIATLQASYTDFHYISSRWKTTTEAEALIGVGVTGICSGPVSGLNLQKAAALVQRVNRQTAEAIGINPSPRCTLVKPAGTTSLMFGCSQGIHSWYAEQYRRRITLAHTEPVYHFLKKQCPAAVELNTAKEGYSWISFPITAPKNSIYRTEKLEDMLERVKKWNIEWVRAGSTGESLQNNVSATVYFSGDAEWTQLCNWMWENRNVYNGLAFFPTYNDTHAQKPMEDCTVEEISQMHEALKPMDLSLFKESSDNTNPLAESACTTDSCEIERRKS
jgi:ribonucleoside-triphosphate reductase (thioredoxin)